MRFWSPATVNEARFQAAARGLWTARRGSRIAGEVRVDQFGPVGAAGCGRRGGGEGVSRRRAAAGRDVPGQFARRRQRRRGADEFPTRRSRASIRSPASGRCWMRRASRFDSPTTRSRSIVGRRTILARRLATRSRSTTTSRRARTACCASTSRRCGLKLAAIVELEQDGQPTAGGRSAADAGAAGRHGSGFDQRLGLAVRAGREDSAAG